MTLKTRLDRLEEKAGGHDLMRLHVVIWDQELETEAEARARDLPPGYDGDVFIVRLVTPESVRKETARHE
ncbi:MAG: hypothetical protein CGW95_15470 [Phenylobacterium zucineum]|nr:MAG: hypothetical protein CGW95_15470 [Phenylobacterium zucineum]